MPNGQKALVELRTPTAQDRRDGVTVYIVKDNKVDVLNFETGRKINSFSSESDAETWCKENKFYIQETQYADRFL